MGRRRVLIVGDRRKERAATLAAALEPALAKLATVVGVDFGGKLDLSRARADLILVLGGDGSILHAARRLGANPIPVMGVNLGHLGFLATLSSDEPPERIARHAAGDFAIEERNRIQVEVVSRRGAPSVLGHAVNDAVLDRGANARMLTLGVRIDGGSAFETRGDGLVVSTPTGSTAYSLASGGPIVHPSLDTVLLTPICPHSLTNRPIVMPSGAALEIAVVDAGGDARIAIDGWTPSRTGLAVGESLRVSRSPQTLRLAVIRGDDFYARLRSKLDFARPASG